MNYYFDHMTNKILEIIFSANEPYFAKVNKYSFHGARTSHGATVVRKRLRMRGRRNLIQKQI